MTLASAAPIAVLRGQSRPDLLKDETLGHILAATACCRPGHPALIWKDRVVTYSALNNDSDTMGRALASRGARPGLVIGLLMPRGADLLTAQAGITKSGSAWLPFDASTPLERVRKCLHSAAAIGLVTCRQWLPRFDEFPVPVWAIEDLLAEASQASIPLSPKPSDPAYVIYTSGSTGEPKGIVISHRAICHFLRSENELLEVRPEDKVYQGFSVAFDMSFEEIWISYLVGASLWIAPPEIISDPDSLVQAWNRERITVVHAVPTLMGLINDPLPTVRLINLGGEACPDTLVPRLASSGRKLFNTYGPTETSVSASVSELAPGKPVTIGMPLPNYGLLVVDEHRRPLPAGETGELCIFGPGLATGYLGNPDLTAQRFICNPLAATPEETQMYLTGDLARIEPGGPVHCLGRADNQVKIRGFRVELEEITSVLAEQPGIAAAAVVMRPIGGVDQLVAFAIPAKHFDLKPSDLRPSLAARLPHYMVPAHFELVSTLPRLASGKINTKALQRIPLQQADMPDESSKPRTEDEGALFAALQTLFPNPRLSPDSDFFCDLGGHSLLAARLVSILRADTRYTSLSVQDIYRERTLEGIARAMEHTRSQNRRTASRNVPKTPFLKRFTCGLAQCVAIPFFILLHIADWLAPFFVYHYFTGEEGDSILIAVLASLGAFVVANLANFPIAILGKRIVAGHLKPGRFSLWGVTHFRWWLANQFCDLPDVYLLAGTPWMPLYLRALGARIGRNVYIDTVSVQAPELLQVEGGVSIGAHVNIENTRVEGGVLIIGPVHLKQESVVDSYSVLEENTSIGKNAKLCAQSALASGRHIPDREIWDGAPARVSNSVLDPLPPRQQIGSLRRCAEAILFAGTAIFVSILFFLPVFPAFMLIDWIDAHTWDFFEAEMHPVAGFGFFFLLAIPASALLVCSTAFLTAGLLHLLPRQKTGVFSQHSSAYWRKRTVSMILDSSLHVLHGLYASVYAPIWLRMLGVKVGDHAEVSTAEGIVPELLTLGQDSFIADGVMLGDEEQRGGWMILKTTQIGNRSFVGNGAYVPDGTIVPDDILIGVQTRAPKTEQLKSGQTWMGSPPLLLPAREQISGFPESLTFRPSNLRRISRGIIEGLRIVIPLASVIATGYLVVILVMPIAEEHGWGSQVAIALSIAGCLYGLASFLFVVALKWILVGRYRPLAAPMWTPFVWITEAVTNLYESLAAPNALNILCGTPVLPWALRLLGVRIGKGVFMNTTDITEFDCVQIGSHAELNAWSGPQTHLFEDRVMKIGNVQIGSHVTVGSRTTILYNTEVGSGVTLGPLTLVAKGENIPDSTRWEGTPAVPNTSN